MHDGPRKRQPAFYWLVATCAFGAISLGLWFTQWVNPAGPIIQILGYFCGICYVIDSWAQQTEESRRRQKATEFAKGLARAREIEAEEWAGRAIGQVVQLPYRS